MSRLLVNFDAFFASKCELDKNKWQKFGCKEVKENDKQMKRCVGELNAADIEKYFEDQNDQNQNQNQNQNKTHQKTSLDQNVKRRQNMNNQEQKFDQPTPNFITAKIAMNMILKGIYELVTEIIPKNIIFDETMIKLEPRQNLLILAKLFDLMSKFGKNLLATINEEGKWKLRKLGEKSTLINWEWYEQLEWCFKRARNIASQLLHEESRKIKRLISYNGFGITHEWNEEYENICGWKLHSSSINGIRFAKALIDYYNFPKKIKILKNGVDEEGFLRSSSKFLKYWPIGIPEIIVKIVKGTEAKVVDIFEKIEFQSHQKERLILEMLTLHRCALHILKMEIKRRNIELVKGESLLHGLEHNMQTVIEKFWGVDIFLQDAESFGKMRGNLLKCQRDKKEFEIGIEDLEEDPEQEVLVENFIEAKMIEAIL